MIAVRLLEQLLHHRHEVLRLLRAALALHVVVDHAGVERAGTIERVQRGQVFELRRPCFPKQVDHAARLELEHALGAPFLEQAEHFGIVERQILDVDVDALDRLGRLDGVVDHRQRAQAEEVHLEQTHLLDHAHVELRHDFIAVRAVQRHVVRDRLGRDHHAGRVHARVPRQPFQPLADLDDLPDFLVVPDRVGELRRILLRVGRASRRDRPGSSSRSCRRTRTDAPSRGRRRAPPTSPPSSRT